MRVIDVIKDTCTFLQLEEELAYLNTYNESTKLFEGDVSDKTEKNINLLVKCFNLVMDTISSEYIKLKDKTTTYTDTGRIPYADITDHNVSTIISVEQDGVVSFADYGGEIVVNGTGKYDVTYLYTLSFCGIEDSIYEVHIPTKTIAYGVASEYLYIERLYDDAAIWDSRFKSSLLNILINKKHRYIKPRRWY